MGTSVPMIRCMPRGYGSPVTVTVNVATRASAAVISAIHGAASIRIGSGLPVAHATHA